MYVTTNHTQLQHVRAFITDSSKPETLFAVEHQITNLKGIFLVKPIESWTTLNILPAIESRYPCKCSPFFQRTDPAIHQTLFFFVSSKT